MHIQAPPNLSPGVLPQLVDAGIDDWGGVSPVTPDFVNPEAPWPHLERLAEETAAAGKTLVERLTVYPEWALDGERWLDDGRGQSREIRRLGGVRTAVLQRVDATGLARTDDWSPGEETPPPAEVLAAVASSAARNGNGTRVPGTAESARFSNAPRRARTSRKTRSPGCSRLAARTSPPSAPPPTRSGAK